VNTYFFWKWISIDFCAESFERRLNISNIRLKLYDQAIIKKRKKSNRYKNPEDEVLSLFNI